MFQKNFFNYQKKINSKYFKDYNFMSLTLNEKVLKILNKQVVNLFNFNENKNFKKIEEVQKFLNKTKFYSLKRNLNIMTNIEKIIFNHFSNLKIFGKHIEGIQFPIDIRMVHPAEPKQMKIKKYLTSSIHCDTWTEEPRDIINVIIYLVVKKNTPKVRLLKSNKDDLLRYGKYPKLYKKKFFLYSKKYFDVLEELEKIESYDINHRDGEVLIFNGFTPHQTIREGNEVRLSLEFRLKTINPYKTFNLWKINNNHGRYWFLPDGTENDFFERLRKEKLKIEKMRNSKKIISLRMDEIYRKLII